MFKHVVGLITPFLLGSKHVQDKGPFVCVWATIAHLSFCIGMLVCRHVMACLSSEIYRCIAEDCPRHSKGFTLTSCLFVGIVGIPRDHLQVFKPYGRSWTLHEDQERCVTSIPTLGCGGGKRHESMCVMSTCFFRVLFFSVMFATYFFLNTVYNL